MNKTGSARAQGSSSRMRDVLKHPKELWHLIRDSVSAWIDDFAASMGAAISYYTVFSIAPLLLIVIAIVGFVYGREAASGQIFDQLRGLFGDEGAAAIQVDGQMVDYPVAHRAQALLDAVREARR